VHITEQVKHKIYENLFLVVDASSDTLGAYFKCSTVIQNKKEILFFLSVGYFFFFN
jgi:hypothetical protein